MDGQTHYREAEKALTYAWSGESADPELTVATAQVHATLALAAATAEAYGQDSPGGPDWSEVSK
jgi:hypothetical protein